MSPRPRADFDLVAIRRYAELKQVRLWTWVHQRALRGRVEEAFAAFEKVGWNGMMVDFFDHDDQESIEFAESILAAAARHRILIHLHGVWKPTGLQRTYPNLMNHEGALNLETGAHLVGRDASAGHRGWRVIGHCPTRSPSQTASASRHCAFHHPTHSEFVSRSMVVSWRNWRLRETESESIWWDGARHPW
jgi:hypothetical protein